MDGNDSNHSPYSRWLIGGINYYDIAHGEMVRDLCPFLAGLQCRVVLPLPTLPEGLMQLTQ